MQLLYRIKMEDLKNIECSLTIPITNDKESALERQESDIKSHCEENCVKLQGEIDELEELLTSKNAEENFSKCFDHAFSESTEKLKRAKMELSTKLREIVSLKRQLDDVPSQAELIQYEHRFSELDVYIQGKLKQTRKYYATYNALLEIKELMLKETSLLDSINSQFQDAISSTGGRAKLIDSMEGILKGIKQKLERVKVGQETEQKNCELLKGKYITALSEQRRCSSLLKSFQEECAKNQRLRSQTSYMPSDVAKIFDPLQIPSHD